MVLMVIHLQMKVLFRKMIVLLMKDKCSWLNSWVLLVALAILCSW